MIDPVAALDTALARIAESEPSVQAWVQLDDDGARAQAARVPPAAPLAGAIVGVKDIYDVAGLPTRCGLLTDARPAERDAIAVQRLRDAGGVILGKTHTTAYAWLDPAPTRNPHDLSRTPGGSSAGSAAAVAAGHCTIALGSQTAGSTLRPASFCGVAGFKPTFKRIPTQGITPLAPSLDHVGIFARNVGDVVAAAGVLDPSLGTANSARRIVVDDLAGDHDAELSTRDALARAAEAFRASGSVVEFVRLPEAVRRGATLIALVVAYEATALHGDRWRTLGHRLPPRLAELLRDGTSTTTTEYAAALAEREALRPAIAEIFGDDAVLLTPSALGEAPDIATTGDARYVRPWTFFGVPAISVPAGAGPQGLPVGVQLVARMGADAGLLATARELEAVFGRLNESSRGA
jgi:Asp-tRNA(Asn)/Glu-tRNA(Gln) amidotransferase A subunit family amidase